jgi:hypothetical protein
VLIATIPQATAPQNSWRGSKNSCAPPPRSSLCEHWRIGAEFALFWCVRAGAVGAWHVFGLSRAEAKMLEGARIRSVPICISCGVVLKLSKQGPIRADSPICGPCAQMIGNINMFLARTDEDAQGAKGRGSAVTGINDRDLPLLR